MMLVVPPQAAARAVELPLDDDEPVHEGTVLRQPNEQQLELVVERECVVDGHAQTPRF